MQVPLGKKYPLLAYGVPAGLGIAAGGLLAGQGEDPGTVALGGAAAALGARGGLGAARVLAGKYNPSLLMSAQKRLSDAENAAIEYALKSRQGGVRETAGNLAADITRSINKAAFGTGMTNAGLPFPTRNVQQNIGRGLAVGLVPGAAAAAGLGGVALGAIPGSMGVPGFVQGGGIDPEHYESSNSPGAIHKLSTLQYGV